MNKFIASLLAGGAAFAMWFHVAPDAEKFLPTDEEGNLVPYTVTRQDSLGKDVVLTFDGLAQSGLASVVKSLPKPL